jgi:hypothetical protein
LKSQKIHNNFSDVPAHVWYQDYVYAAYEAKIVDGLSDTTFGPDELLTREQMSVLITKAYLYATGKSSIEAGSELKYSDSSSISPWAKDAISGATQLGLVNGEENGAFHPQDHATRAQASVIAARLLNLLQK